MKEVTYHPTIYQTIPISLDLTDYWNKTPYRHTWFSKIRRTLAKLGVAQKGS